MSDGTQALTIDTFSGKRTLLAPAGWKFNATDARCWLWMLQNARDRAGKLKTQREGIILDAKIDALAIVLANSLGMASFYWNQEARRYIKEGIKYLE